MKHVALDSSTSWYRAHSAQLSICKVSLKHYDHNPERQKLWRPKLKRATPLTENAAASTRLSSSLVDVDIRAAHLSQWFPFPRGLIYICSRAGHAEMLFYTVYLDKYSVSRLHDIQDLFQLKQCVLQSQRLETRIRSLGLQLDL